LKKSQYDLPPLFFSGVFASYFSETEIVAHKQQMLKEIRETQSQKSINSCLSVGSPGEIRTLISGSRAQIVQNQSSFVINDVDWTVSDFGSIAKL